MDANLAKLRAIETDIRAGKLERCLHLLIERLAGCRLLQESICLSGRGIDSLIERLAGFRFLQ